MDKQAIFNKAADHMLAQGCRATQDDDDTLCAYENKEGLMCAMGIFFPTNHPARWSSLGIDGVLSGWPELNDVFRCEHDEDGDILTSDIMFLIGLQNIHDSVEVKDWRQALNGFAQRYDLEGVGP